MKRLKYALCIGSLILVSIAVLLFLNVFTSDADKTMAFIDFDSYAVKNEDGTLTQMTMDEFYSVVPEKDQVFVFTATVTEDNYDDYIQFTPTGMDIRVLLGDTEVYHSDSNLPEDTIDQITSRIPIRGMELPLTVTMECRHLGGANTVFPPMLFATSDMTEMLPNLAWGHRGGIPTGAFAVIFLVLLALFLYSIIEGKPRYSMVALVVASAILMVRGICAESGYPFLPEWMITVFTRTELLWFLFAAFITYLALNYKKIKLIGWCTLGSVAIFAGTYFVSLATGGSFALLVKGFINSLIEFGDYTIPLLWINFLLQFICLFVAGITTVRSVSEHIAREQAFELKAELAMENYRVIEEQSKHDAVVRHEFKNHISAIKLMLEQDKTADALEYLNELEGRSHSTAKFTGNFAINAILQNAAARAEELGFRIEAYARAEEELAIPESDLCGLLFNLLDNSFEALEQIEDVHKRKLNIRIKQRGDALGIYCENTYAVAPEFDHNGKLVSKKREKGHGLGVTQMERIARKYKGKLDFSYSDDLFIAQTVLFLPHKKRKKAPQEATTE